MAGNSASERVIIVGGGPVGLATSLELARFGIASVVLERHPQTSWHPKTRNINTRTMEIARGWGNVVYERLRGIDTPPGWKSPIRFMESVCGEEFGRIDTLGFVGPGPDVSPALPVMSSQELLEKILFDAAAASGYVDLRFGHQVRRVLSGWREGDRAASIEAEVRESGKTYELTGPALVAADGVDSLVRQELGVPLLGDQGISHFVNCYFRADIEQYVGDRTGVLFFVANPGAAGVLQPLDARGRWLCQISVTPADWEAEAYSNERCQQWIRAAVGADDLEPEILGIGRWRMNATVVERLVHNRVVLCGDAAHQFPPPGGLGVNTGLQGMHNAMWKLAFCVQGLAEWPLLGTYDDERRQVARWIADQSLQNTRNVGMIALSAMKKLDSGMSTQDVVTASRRYGNHLGVEFGAFYKSNAVLPDGTSPPDVVDSYSDYEQSATPGCRSPHVWLGRGDARLSTLDLFGPGFTVLTAADSEAWRRGATAARQQYGVNVGVYSVGDPGLEDVEGKFAALYGIGESGAVLVRPDGYVGWRAQDNGGDDAGGALCDAVCAILGRQSGGAK